MKTYTLILVCLFVYGRLNAQCPPLGDEVTYGTSDTWIGYLYDNADFTTYAGYVTEGTPGNMNFDENFSGDNVNYTTNGCSVYTETFSARYKLNKTFTNGFYEIIVGGDDGYRFSIDGGATWVINNWGDHPYAITNTTVLLNGNYNLVVEFYENGGQNRVSFNIQPACMGTDDQSVYGTNNVWRGYVYDNLDLTNFKGTVTEGSLGNPYFDQSFGGDNVTYNTNSCAVNTQTFSVRYRLQKSFANTSTTFLIGGDDGYRFSLDGGATWVINQWNDHGYNTNSYTATLNGTYDMVLEFYENGGGNRISFDMNSVILPIQLLQFTGKIYNEQVQLNWTTSSSSNTDHFIIEKSTDGQLFLATNQVKPGAGIVKSNGDIQYTYTDVDLYSGTMYYRLKMVDQNDIISYSNIITLKNNMTGQLKIYPTVIKTNTPLTLQTAQQTGNITIIVIDMLGRPIMQYQQGLLNNQTITVPLPWSQMRKGAYMVQVKNATGILINQKILAQ